MSAKIALKVLIFLIGAIFIQSAVNAHVEQPKDFSGIGIDEKLGHLIPLDLTFHDENGNRVTLRQFIHTPTILALVYLHCPNVCSLLLQNLANVLDRLPADPGKEYIAVSISFDDREKSALALEKKKTYLKMIQKSFPPEAWRFLTGDHENIHKLTDAVGFHFKRIGDDFEHPVTLIILAPDGKIVRYMYGADPLPLDVRLALVEAAQGRIGPTIAKVVRFCFRYDPKANKLVFNMLKVTGTVTLLFALSFILFLLLKGKKPHKEEKGA